MFTRAIRAAALLAILSGLMTLPASAGTTGKIAGKITDARTREPIIGATVILQGTPRGAATDPEGEYFINNVSPGTYNVAVSIVGYQRAVVRNVIVKIDLTTDLDVKLEPSMVEAGEVVIEAERPLVQKDLTSSSVTVSNEDIKMIPVDNPISVVNLQAGVVGGHFRGGRLNEVAYLVDGVTVTDPYNGGISLQVENSSVREMEVISGTFNAEYGQAMSGVVNIVTMEGSQDFHGTIAADFGDYWTQHDETFRNLNAFSPGDVRNAQVSFSGPVPFLENLSFFGTARYFYDQGYLYGTKVYNVTDNVPTFPLEPDRSVWINHNTGDASSVAMNPYEKRSVNAKLAYGLEAFKASYSFFYDENWNKYYDHSFSWTPDGIQNHYRTNRVHNLQLTYVPSQSTFLTLKYSFNDFSYQGYLYRDAVAIDTLVNGSPALVLIDDRNHNGLWDAGEGYHPQYLDPDQGTPLSGYTFRSGGNQAGRYERASQANIVQAQVASQISKQHKIGAGIEGRFHNIFDHGYSVVNLTPGITDPVTGALIFTPGYRALGTIGNQQYTKKPVEWSAYLQDKMEYDIMIINAGVRLDYFDPNSSYLYDSKNPTRNDLFPYPDSLVEADAKVQVSPRLGISFPITDQGIIHFSYGHFFQMPSFQYLYQNSDYLVQQGEALTSTMGNPDLEAQRTIMYEIGLQQVIFPNVALDITAYYRDIRNLLGMEIINTYEGIKYARFTNRDYGNVRGIILSLDKRMADWFAAKIDYTYQFAEGNASDPYSVYNNNQTDPPIETNKQTVPLDWDQRNTVTASFTVGDPLDWTVGLVFQYGSGFPYTQDTRVSQGIRFENDGTRPPTFNLDLRAEKRFSIDMFDFNVFLLVYNLLDIKNEVNVNSASGRANVDLYTEFAGTIYGLNTIDQYLNDPTSFSAPRQVRFGVTATF
jgi:outer membrane receptor protein involved in Fe transport